jgi:predicted DNA binding CopG/RHH family protein
MSAKMKTRYTDEPIEARVIRDFLPSPKELAFREEGVKVTIALSKKSVDFFKSEASKNRTQYQRMIRKLIDAYVDSYGDRPAARPARVGAARA